MMNKKLRQDERHLKYVKIPEGRLCQRLDNHPQAPKPQDTPGLTG